MDSNKFYHAPSGRWLSKKELKRMLERRILNYLEENKREEYIIVDDVPQSNFLKEIFEEEGFNYRIIKRTEEDVISFIKNNKNMVFCYILEDCLNIFFHFLVFDDIRILKDHLFPLSIISEEEIRYFVEVKRIFNKWENYIGRLTEGPGNLKFSFVRGFLRIMRY